MSEARKQLVIAIDGPAGAGKSTIAARLARKLGYVNIETGAMYRALALKAVESDVSFDDEEALVHLAARTKIRLEPTLSGNRVILDNQDVSNRIREDDVTQAASRVSVHPKVRQWMVQRQRAMGESGGVVMEGRDIGTKVFPDADLKVFLDADPEVRGDRRYRQVSPAIEPPLNRDRDAILADLRERDRRDRSRANSPLEPAADAVVIDSTRLTVDEVLDQIESLVSERAT
jgi:cytidylate kinase